MANHNLFNDVIKKQNEAKALPRTIHCSQINQQTLSCGNNTDIIQLF